MKASAASPAAMAVLSLSLYGSLGVISSSMLMLGYFSSKAAMES